MTTPRHILLAEDDPLDARLTLSALGDERLGCAVFTVSDGEEVLDYLYRRGKFASREEGAPAALLLDLKMPKIDGLTALKIIKSDRLLKTVPVIMLTSSRQRSDLKECYESGVNAYVVKPLESDDFDRVVHQLGLFWSAINEMPPEMEKAPVE